MPKLLLRVSIRTRRGGLMKKKKQDLLGSGSTSERRLVLFWGIVPAKANCCAADSNENHIQSFANND
jgi:hypothetical protein